MRMQERRAINIQNAMKADHVSANAEDPPTMQVPWKVAVDFHIVVKVSDKLHQARPNSRRAEKLGSRNREVALRPTPSSVLA